MDTTKIGTNNKNDAHNPNASNLLEKSSYSLPLNKTQKSTPNPASNQETLEQEQRPRQLDRSTTPTLIN